MPVKESLLSKGQALWQRALQAIPGGNGLLSKRPERFASELWPAYFSKARGVEIWDLDGHRFIDMSLMGIGTAVLGYSDPEVDSAVKAAVDRGVNTTLNAPEEVYLAEKLLALNPFAGGVKFARSGGEAMAIAVRIARHFTGRDKVAFSGYHGWCDWYLAANLAGDGNLDGHLLPGLSPRGVPRGLRDTALPFEYNNVQAFKQLLAQHPDIGVIVIEGARHDLPSVEFLDAIQTAARERQQVIVIDEITSGWRVTDGGVYKTTGFRPDMVVYGKAMGNGYAISAVLGRKEVMDAAGNTFLSSTFWTERIGFVAALSTIDKFTKNRAWERLITIGTRIGDGWEMLARKHALKLSCTAFKPLITMKFDYGQQNAAVATLFIQEMVKRGYLATTSVYVSYAHTEAIANDYLRHVDEVFAFIAKAVETNTVLDELETKVRDEGFRRLN